MSAHTPGPWDVAYLDGNGQSVVKAEHTEVCTCWHHCVGAIEKEMHANARLIASAPDLLEAVRDLLGHFPTDTDMQGAGWSQDSIEDACRAYDRANVTFSKATGSPGTWATE